MKVDTEEVILYWIQGCANCTRLKGYLSERGIAFQAVNVMDDSDASAEMERRGIRSLPVVRTGDRWVNGIDLSKVDELLNLQPEPAGCRLSIDELIDRSARLLETAAQLAVQIPVDRELEPTPTMENYSGAFFQWQDGSPYVPHSSYKSLAFHLAAHGERMKRHALAFDGVYELGFEIELAGDEVAFGEPDIATPMYRVARQMRLCAADLRSWLVTHPNPDLSRAFDTYYGKQTVHELIQTNLCSLVQHTRQLVDVVERVGAEPASRVITDDFEGLVMPAGIWE